MNILSRLVSRCRLVVLHLKSKLSGSINPNAWVSAVAGLKKRFLSTVNKLWRKPKPKTSTEPSNGRNLLLATVAAQPDLNSKISFINSMVSELQKSINTQIEEFEKQFEFDGCRSGIIVVSDKKEINPNAPRKVVCLRALINKSIIKNKLT